MNDWKLNPAKDLGKTPSERWSSVEREGGLLESATTLCWRKLITSYLKIAHRFECQGKENIPSSLPYVIVANHSSHLDALCITAALPRRHSGEVYSIAAADTFFTNLTTSWFAAFAINALPISRSGGGKGQEAMSVMRSRLIEEPCGLILFPEGTRTRDGNISPFRSGLGTLVANTAVPVIPAAIVGAYEALPPQRSIPRLNKIHLKLGVPLLFTEIENNESGWKQVAAASEAAVRKLSGDF